MAVHDERTLQRLIVEELVTRSGWVERPHTDVDRTTRLLVDDLIGFLTDTQPAAVERFAAVAGSDWRTDLAAIVAADLDKQPGRTLGLLRGGKRVKGGVTFRFAQFKPTSGLNADLVAAYANNRLTVVQEAPVRRRDGTWGAVDLALFVNGIPVADAELKNSLTGQGTADAVRQYRRDRHPDDTLLRYRSVVHFAVDTDAVMMATDLLREGTTFLPFNRGSAPDGQGGAGNHAPGDGGHLTSYLWREVWQRDAWLDLLHRFVHVEPADPTDPTSAPAMIFPRYHQWDAVRRLAADAAERGPGHAYLVQHSAGSGKSNTIGWLAHRLTTLTDPTTDERIFDKVVVITDRRVLDAQLAATVTQFEQASAKGRVVSVASARELAEALARPSSRIVVTTLQKFPVANQLEVLQQVTGRFAVVIDEAHSSQSGEGAKQLKQALGGASAPTADLTTGEVALEYGPEDMTALDQVAAAISASAAARGRPANLSFFAFTATPKGKTLELFGTPDGEGQRRPAHLYSMRQAIEEGFILDPLQRYTTYETLWRVTTESGREVERSRASAAIARYAQLHETMIRQKAEITATHFHEHVAHLLGGRAKAMVVTRSRLAAVRWTQMLRQVIADLDLPLGVLVAFSGTVPDPDVPGIEHTEASLNGVPESQTVTRFAGDDHHLLVVAEKYQTGFDQPLLQAMYVDKKLDGVAAVQTLGRLNRIAPGKEPPFVLDFVNDHDDIAAAFEPYYEGAVGLPTDDQLLYEVWQRLRDSHVLDDADLHDFAIAFFTAPPGSTAHHPALHRALEPAEHRLADLDDDAREAFRQAAQQFVRMYGFLAQVLPYTDDELERAHPYLRMLLRRMGSARGDALDLSEEVELSHLGIRDGLRQAIALSAAADPQTSFTGTGQGSLTEDERLLLTQVVDRINERFGATVTEQDKLTFQSLGEQMAADEALQQQAAANDEATFAYAFEDAYVGAVIDAMEHHSDLGKRLLDDAQFAAIVKPWLLRYVHRRAAERHAVPELDLDVRG